MWLAGWGALLASTCTYSFLVWSGRPPAPATRQPLSCTNSYRSERNSRSRMSCLNHTARSQQQLLGASSDSQLANKFSACSCWPAAPLGVLRWAVLAQLAYFLLLACSWCWFCHSQLVLASSYKREFLLLGCFKKEVVSSRNRLL